MAMEGGGGGSYFPPRLSPTTPASNVPVVSSTVVDIQLWRSSGFDRGRNNSPSPCGYSMVMENHFVLGQIPSFSRVGCHGSASSITLLLVPSREGIVSRCGHIQSTG